MTLGILLSISSCFTDEEPIQPLPPMQGMIKTNWIDSGQIYYSLRERDIVKANGIYDWDLAFSCKKGDYTILMNSSKGMGCFNTGSKDFFGAYLEDQYPLSFDKSNGQDDQSAIGTWGDFKFENPQSYGDVYILHLGLDLLKNPIGKVKFRVNGFSNNSYSIRIGSLTNPNDYWDLPIPKNDSFNFVYLSFAKRQIKHLEPPKNEWDLLFTQYTVPIGKNIPRPIFPQYQKHELVDGILLNPYNREIARDSNAAFDDINFFKVESFDFTNRTDLIGQWWYTYSDETHMFDTSANTGYVIRDEDKNFYAIKFVKYIKNDKMGCTSRFILKNL